MNPNVPGMLTFYFVAAILLTVPASLLVLVLYRRAVLRGMRQSGAETLEAAAAAEPDERTADVRQPPPSRELSTAVRLRLAVVYAFASLAASAVLTSLYMLDLGYRPTATQVLTTLWALSWPYAAILPALLVLRRRQAVAAVLGYVLLGLVSIVVWWLASRLLLGRPPFSLPGNLLGALALLGLSAMSYVIILATGNRKLRPVSPLLLAGLLLFGIGTLGLQQTFIWGVGLPFMRAFPGGFGTAELAWFLLASLPVGLLCWLAGRWISARFTAKRFSDTQLLVDAWWLIAIFQATISLSTSLGWTAMLGLLAFVAYRGAVALGLGLWPAAPAADRPWRLLLLRVFGHRSRTERLFDAVAQRWRLLGNVNMITGPDLAGRTLDPGETTRYLAAGAGAQFVSGGGDLALRLAALDERRDPDGRFRVNDFCCRDDVWRPTLAALLARSDLVLMDLRGLSEDNSGCRFELEEIVRQGRMRRTLFVVDRSTDVGLLREILGAEEEPNLQTLERQTGLGLATVHEGLLALAA